MARCAGLIIVGTPLLLAVHNWERRHFAGFLLFEVQPKIPALPDRRPYHVTTLAVNRVAKEMLSWHAERGRIACTTA
jgi:hypothetical protein